jgi:hypothetical protein
MYLFLRTYSTLPDIQSYDHSVQAQFTWSHFLNIEFGKVNHCLHEYCIRIVLVQYRTQFTRIDQNFEHQGYFDKYQKKS